VEDVLDLVLATALEDLDVVVVATEKDIALGLARSPLRLVTALPSGVDVMVLASAAVGEHQHLNSYT